MPTAPYDIVMTSMNTAKVRLNDAISTLLPVTGKLIENTQAFSQQVVNSAYRRLQAFLANLGYSKLNEETVFTGVPATGSIDPIVQSYISWTTFFNGSGTVAAPVLPQDLIVPLELWERPTGSGASMTEMSRAWSGLPKVPKLQWNGQWEWRQDAVYLPGALVATDISLRYASFLADFADNTPTAATPWYGQPVPIMYSSDALALFICDEINRARSQELDAAGFGAEAERMAALILDRDTLGPKGIYKTSEFSKMADRYTPATGPNTQPAKRGQ